MNPQTSQQYRKLKGLGNVTMPYGGSTRYEKFHPGLDIANREGTPVPAMASGTVVGVEMGHAPGENNFGNRVLIKDDQGNTQYYSHVKNAFVKRGQRVHSGQPVAAMGKTGSAYSPSGGDPTHIDLRVVDAYGKYKNPLQYMSQVK